MLQVTVGMLKRLHHGLAHIPHVRLSATAIDQSCFLPCRVGSTSGPLPLNAPRNLTCPPLATASALHGSWQEEAAEHK